jgi:hypothetical protein
LLSLKVPHPIVWPSYRISLKHLSGFIIIGHTDIKTDFLTIRIHTPFENHPLKWTVFFADVLESIKM